METHSVTWALDLAGGEPQVQQDAVNAGYPPLRGQTGHVGIVARSGQEPAAEPGQPGLGRFQRPGVPVDGQYGLDRRFRLQDGLGVASLSGGAVHVGPALLQRQLMDRLRQKYRPVGNTKIAVGSMTGAVHKLR